MFNLPPSTLFNQSIPKKYFYVGLKHKQTQAFVDEIEKIHWKHKLSAETINLSGEHWQEVQVIEVNLKRKSKINNLLDIMDRLIPYLVIFVVCYEEEVYLSAAIKHPNPNDASKAVIDTRFERDWASKSILDELSLDLSRTLDYVFDQFCKGLADIQDSSPQLTGEALAEYHDQREKLKKEIEQLHKKIKRCKQFNQRVKLNMEKKAKEIELEKMDQNNL